MSHTTAEGFSLRWEENLNMAKSVRVREREKRESVCERERERERGEKIYMKYRIYMQSKAIKNGNSAVAAGLKHSLSMIYDGAVFAAAHTHFDEGTHAFKTTISHQNRKKIRSRRKGHILLFLEREMKHPLHFFISIAFGSIEARYERKAPHLLRIVQSIAYQPERKSECMRERVCVCPSVCERKRECM